MSILGQRRYGVLFFLALVLLLNHLAAFADDLSVWRYRVRPGDNLSTLAQNHLQAPYQWAHVVRFNKLSQAPRILIGQELKIPLAWLKRSPAPASLIHVSGHVQMASTDGIWQFAPAGANLSIGQMLRVGPDSSARIQFADASVLLIQPNTTIVLDTLSVYANGHMADTTLRLQSGRVEIRANPHHNTGQQFEVITPAAVAAVRGTHFMVLSESNRTIEQTYEGQVIVQSRLAKVLVPKGYGSTVDLGALPTAPSLIQAMTVTPDFQTKFVELPIVFSWSASSENGKSQWVMQLGHDPEVGDVFREQVSPQLQANWGALRNGSYYLRFWQLDANGIPSLPKLHPFEVAIARKLQGTALQLANDLFKTGPLELNLTPLPQGLRYWLELTQDAEGNQVIWQDFNIQLTLKIPTPPLQEKNHHLWIWTY